MALPRYGILTDQRYVFGNLILVLMNFQDAVPFSEPGAMSGPDWIDETKLGGSQRLSPFHPYGPTRARQKTTIPSYL
jgi:hypothetical protein